MKSGILCEYISDHLPMICALVPLDMNKNKIKTITKTKITEVEINLIADKIKTTNWNNLNTMDTNNAYITHSRKRCQPSWMRYHLRKQLKFLLSTYVEISG